MRYSQIYAANMPCNVQQQVSVEWVCVIGGVYPSAPVAHTSKRRGDVGGHLDLWLKEGRQSQGSEDSARKTTKVAQETVSSCIMAL